MVDEQRCLVVRQSDGVRLGEAGVEIAKLQHLAFVHRLRERDLHVASPFRPLLTLLVDGDSLGQPARDSLLRHLKRDDVGELVPQRGLPAERARGPRPRGIERHNATEARAERANHAGQPQVTNGEVVVVREDLHENRAGRCELVAGRQCRERVLRERNGIFAEDWRLVAMHFQDEIAIANGDELIQLVQHLSSCR